MELAELGAAVAEVCGVLNAAHARLVALVAEALASDAWQGWGIHSPAQWVAWQTGLSPSRAAEIVRVASRRDELPATVAAFDAGALALDQVAVIARKVPAAYEAASCELARSATVAQLRRVVNAYPFDDDRAADEPAERCSFHHDDDGRFHLHAVGDPVGGATVEAALQEAKDALFRDGEHDASWWDALVEIAQRSLATVPEPRQDRFGVYLHVDITHPEVTISRLTNGVPIPASVRDRLLCDATVQPVWVRDNVPVGVGHPTPVISTRTRRVVLHRDHGQCQVPGCDRRRVELHHIDHREHGGPTQTWNLLSICSRHHHLHHGASSASPATLTTRTPSSSPIRAAAGSRAAGSPRHPRPNHRHQPSPMSTRPANDSNATGSPSTPGPASRARPSPAARDTGAAALTSWRWPGTRCGRR